VIQQIEELEPQFQSVLFCNGKLPGDDPGNLRACNGLSPNGIEGARSE
jgi:hypothetical protein